MADLLSQAFSLADLVGTPLLTQYLGDALDSIADDLLVLPDPTTPGQWQLAVQLDGPTPDIPLVGNAIFLDLGSLPGASGANPPAALVFATVAYTTSPFTLTVTPVNNIRLKVSPDLLTPLDGNPAVYFGVLDTMSIVISAAGVKFSSGALTLVLPKCGIGQTGVQLNGGTVTLALWGTNDDPTLPPLGVTDAFRGVVLQNISLTLPSDLAGMTGLSIPSGTISKTGFSGTLNVNPIPAGAAVTLFGATIVPQSLSVTIAQNSLTGAALAAKLTLPFFDQTVAVTASINDGSWALSLATGGTTINGPWFKLVLVSLGIQHQDGKTWYKVNGSLTPLVPDFPYALPNLDLKDILIDGLGMIKAAGGAMTLSSQQTFQLGDVLMAKLTKFSFGGDGAKGRYIALSGGIDLIEGLPLQADFDTLKIGWDGSSAPTLTLAGAKIDLEIPDLFAFKGSLKYPYPDSSGPIPGFVGTIQLSIIPAQMEIDGYFAVAEKKDGNGKIFTALGVEIDLTLPAAIPLMQTNLGIYGFNGLVAWNYAPNLPRYGNDWFQWFMGWTAPNKSNGVQEIGVTGQCFLDKWGPVKDKKGAGAGFTLGTMVDTGFSWHAKATFIVLVPGPDLILAGQCNFVSVQPGMGDDMSGAFQLMIAYDGDAETLTAAISATVGKDPIFYASGAACAFFDFNNPAAWYLDIGTKSVPIQATVAKILNGTAYLDLSANELDAGAQAGYSGNFHVGPLTASVSAHVGFDAVLTRHPLRLTGDATLQGSLKVSAWKVSANVGLNAQITMDAVVVAALPPQVAYKFHFEIQAELHAHVLFADLSASETVSLTVSGGTPDNPDPPVYPLKAISLELPAHTAETWPLPLTQTASGSALPELDVTQPDAPVQNVPMDGLPTLVFSVPVYDQGSIGTNPPLDGSIQVGNTAYSYTLVSIVIKDGTGKVAYSSLASDQNAPTRAVKIWGQWCEELGDRGKTRLQLFADNPYFLSLRTTPSNRLADATAVRGPAPCAGISTNVSGTCVSVCDFPWTAVDHGPEVFMMDGAETAGFSFAVKGPRPCGHLPPNKSFEGKSTGCWVVVERGDSLTLPAAAALIRLTAVTVTLPGPPPRVVNPVPLPAALVVEVLDASGNVVTMQGSQVTSGTNVTFTLRMPTANAVRIVFTHTLAVSGVCIFNQQQALQLAAAPALNTQLGSALQAGASGTLKPAPFAAFTRYSIEVVVSYTGGSSGTFTADAAFTTGGPPGILGPNPPADKKPNNYPFGGSLVDLARYAAAAIPQGDAGRAFPFDNPYRGYNPCVIFNEGYLLAMYQTTGVGRGQGAALVLDVVDANGASLTAQNAGLVSPVHLAPPSVIDGFRGLWASRLSSQCGITQQYPANSGLGLTLDPRVALAPRRQYAVQVSAPDFGNVSRILYRQNFSSSRFLTVTHHLQSHPDAAFPLALDAAASFASLAQAAGFAGQWTAQVTDAEAALFDQIRTDLKLAPAAPRETLDGSCLYATDGTCRAVLFTTPEPLPWDRLLVNSAKFAATPTAITRPSRMAITDFSINAGNGFVDLMLLDDADPSGISITDSYQLLLPPIRRIVSQPIYTFANEGVWPSGTVFRLVSGQTAVATADLQQRQLPAGAFARFGQTISAYAGAKLLHQRNIAASYAPWNFRIVRQRDGSTFFLVASDAAGHPANLPVGEFVLNLTVNRSLGAADPGNLRLWLRGNSTAATEVLNWRVRVPART